MVSVCLKINLQLVQTVEMGRSHFGCFLTDSSINKVNLRVS